MTRDVVLAAGVLPYRLHEGALQVTLVHRPRHDDWSWPKGKLERGEDVAAAAVRETREETGLQVRLGMPLPTSRYPLGSGAEKVVRYWAGQVVAEIGDLEHEVDAVEWLSPTLAARRLTHDRDREQLAEIVSLHRGGRLDTWTLLVVRHSHALARSRWTQPDPERPLSAVGRRWSERLVPTLAAYAPDTVLSSPSTRCVQTLEPFLAAVDQPMVTKKGLSEEGHSADPDKLDKHLGRLLEAAEQAAVCTHGPVLKPLVGRLWELAAPELPPAHREELAGLGESNLDKGEVLACTMLGRGDQARIVAVERHRPPASSC